MPARFEQVRPLVLVAFLATAAAPPTSAAAREVTIAAVGDIMMGSNYPMNALPADGGAGLFDAAAAVLRAADITFGNLEGTLTDARISTKDVSTGRAYAFRTPPAYAGHLADAGFDVMSLANNHILDFGFEGVTSTHAALRDWGIQFAGQDGSIATFVANGVTVAFVAADTTLFVRNIVFPEALLSEIEGLSARYDIVVVSIHAGAEGASALHTPNTTEFFLGENRGNVVAFAHQAIDRGADLILGHGPHVPRGLEVYRDRLIAYSLGNFCNYVYFNLTGPMGLAPVLEVTLAGDGQFIAGRIHSFVQVPPGAPRADYAMGAAALIADLSRADFPASSPVFDATGGFVPRTAGEVLAALEPETVAARSPHRRGRPGFPPPTRKNARFSGLPRSRAAGRVPTQRRR